MLDLQSRASFLSLSYVILSVHAVYCCLYTWNVDFINQNRLLQVRSDVFLFLEVMFSFMDLQSRT